MVRSSIPALVLSVGLTAILTAQTQQPAQADGATAPVLTRSVEPIYPELARKAGVAGVVSLDVTVGVDGTVTNARITKSIPLLDVAAITAVRQWTYSPAMLNGVAVPATVQVDVWMPPPVRVGGLVRPPVKIVNVEPVYPPDMRAAGTQGVVILELTIDGTGKVARVRVLRSVAGLDEAAIEAVKQWVFEPTLLNGTPTAILYNVTVTFRLA